jgi:hypothetical protein
MEDQMMSLYDYLGYAAGSSLGDKVYKAAAQQKVPVGVRGIANKVYTGKVMLYPESFLKEYFENQQR